MESKSGYPPLPSAPYSEVDLNGAAPPPSYDQATHVNPPIQPAGYHPVPQYQPDPMQQFPMHPLQPQQPQQIIHNTIIVQNPVGPHSTRTWCPSCQLQITTRVSHDNALRTHLMALLLCIFCLPCCCIPYMCNSCKDANHYCPNCNCFIGSYRYERHRRY